MFKGIRRAWRAFWLRDETELVEDNSPYVNQTKARGSKVRALPSISRDMADSINGMNFTVYNATGGKVIQLSSYDSRTDSNRTSLYVITDQENLGEELAQILPIVNLSGVFLPSCRCVRKDPAMLPLGDVNAKF